MTDSVPRRDNAGDGTRNPNLQGSDQNGTTNGGVPNCSVFDSIVGESRISSDRDELSYSQTIIEMGDPSDRQSLAHRRAELEVRRAELEVRRAELEVRKAELEVEQDVQTRRHQWRFDAVAQILIGLTNLIVLAAGIYLTTTGKDIGAFMMGIGGTGGAMTGIQVARR